MRRVLGCLLAALLVVGGGACARIDEARHGVRPTRAAFVTSAEAMCAAATTVMKEAGLDTLGERPPTVRLAAYRTALLARRAGYLTIRDQRSPADDGAHIRAFADAALTGIDQLSELTRAQDRRDPHGEDLARTRAAAAFTLARSYGKALGFTTCLP